jgi:hypothetical protein
MTTKVNCVYEKPLCGKKKFIKMVLLKILWEFLLTKGTKGGT